MAHGVSAEHDEPMAEMNMIPLIDIALVLLIILMVTTAFIKHPGVALKLPETKTHEGAPETNKDLTISVTADGRLYMDGKEQTNAQVEAQLKGIAATNKESRILVKGDRNVQYSKVMEVMDMVRQAGLSRVVLPTDPKRTEAASAPADPVPAPTP